MIQIKEFFRPESLEDAMKALSANKNATLIGGGAYLRLGSKNISTAIDLSKLGLNTIEEYENHYAIGAMVSFGQLERSERLNDNYHGLFGKALMDVVGIQFRNGVTVGGTVFSRYGFSDLLPPLLALDAEVVLHQAGPLKLEKFLSEGAGGKDILTHVKIPKNCTAATFQSARLSTGDYAALNMVLAQVNGTWRIAVGARPSRAALAIETMEILNSNSWSEKVMAMAVECIGRELAYGSNTRGSEIYRRQLAGVLLKKAMMEVQKSC